MKRIFYVFSLLAISIVAISLTSCNNDEDTIKKEVSGSINDKQVVTGSSVENINNMVAQGKLTAPFALPGRSKAVGTITLVYTNNDVVFADGSYNSKSELKNIIIDSPVLGLDKVEFGTENIKFSHKYAQRLLLITFGKTTLKGKTAFGEAKNAEISGNFLFKL